MSNLLVRDLGWLVSFLAWTFGFLLALVLLAQLLRQKRPPGATIAWLLVIFFLPYVGVPLYLIFGGRKMQRLAEHKARVYQTPTSIPRDSVGGATERILRSHGVPPATSGNVIALAGNGEVAYHNVLRLIDEAEREIHVTTYILGDDAVGREIVDRLARRASEGVTVRVLIDSVGTWWLRRKLIAPLVAAGAGVAFFMPMIHLPMRGRANLRNHRKIVVTDGRKALAGGMNLAAEYMGPTPDPNRWRDLSVLVEGPAARDLDDLFRSDWKFTTGEDLAGDHAETLARVSDGDGDGDGDDAALVQVVASGPDVTGDPFYEALLSLLFSAKRRIWVVTPYFVPDETLARALELAARRGVDVKLLVPARSNHLAADLARGSYLRQVFEAGGQVLQFGPTMVHAKVVVIDDALALVGSANMDMRSLFLNFEVALFFYSPTQVQAVAEWVQGLRDDCRAGLPERGWGGELAENVARLLSPLL